MRTLITPDMAKKILEKNTINRYPVNANISFLVQEILSDRFLYNGESIIISENGNLMDGQHRLMAVVKANKSIEANLVEGILETTMNTIDTGAARTAGHVFSMQGVPNANSMAAMVKGILEKAKTNRLTDKKGTIKLSSQVLYDFYILKKDILVEILRFTSSLHAKSVKFSSPSAMGVYLYLFSLESKKAKNFIRELMTGVQEYDSDAALKLRDKLINNKISTMKISYTKERDMIIYSWRKYLEGKDVKVFTQSSNMTFISGNVSELNSKLSIDNF